ncbi:MAG: TonB-dependent receptor [Candidatus Tectomicrobia bacterium]|uniref:TonB-dependent receptor n=1 Tax=Tectimicrobiota bacterium TaxID=2528274 RepID=A0A932CMR3_UNCTE|nr:TonB-dependent receptor [Candidatus Tectomicrobia bacterium]
MISTLVALALALLSSAAGADQEEQNLLDLSLEELVEVKITGASKYEQKVSEVPAAASVITAEEIKTFGWRTLGEALASLPGTFLTYDRQYLYLGTRGFGPPGDFNTRVLLTMDGMRLNDVVYDMALFGNAFTLDPSLIERIEFIPGPGSAVYGQNALFAVVNIVTRTGGSFNGAELAGAYHGPQDTGQGRGTWGKQLDNGVDLLLSFPGMYSEGEDRSYAYPGTGISGEAKKLDGERYHKLFARASKGPWLLELAYSDRKKFDPTAVYFGIPLVPDAYQRDRDLATQLVYEKTLPEHNLQIHGRLFRGQHWYSSDLFYDNGVTPPPTKFFFIGNSTWWGGEMRILSTAFNRHKLMLGLEYQKNQRYRQQADDTVLSTTIVDIDKSGYRYGIYLQDEWVLRDGLTVFLGGRYDRNNVLGGSFSPRAALVWKPWQTTTLKFLYGRAHRAPNSYERDYDDQVAQLGNPALRGEQIDTLELAAEHWWGRDLRLRGSIYQWTMRHLIELKEIGEELSQYQNGDDIVTRGVELELDKRWSWGGRVRTSFSFQRGESDTVGDRLINSPRTLAKLNFSSPLWSRGIRLGYELHYHGDRRDKNLHKVGGYWLNNLHLVADGWIKGLEVSVGIYNLFDRKYAHPASQFNWQDTLEQDGRSVRFKLLYRF